VADVGRAVERIVLALAVAGAAAAGVADRDAANEAGVGSGAVRAGGVAIARGAQALVADVSRAIVTVGLALRVARAARAAVAAGVLRRDAADLAGRAVVVGVVAVTLDAAAGEADVGG